MDSGGKSNEGVDKTMRQQIITSPVNAGTLANSYSTYKKLFNVEKDIE